LGLLLAERLVGRGARHLALVGRRRASEEAEKAIARLKATGAKVTSYQCDVADYDKMAGVFQAIARSSPPLRGIFHCAGETDDGVLLQQNWSRFRTVMAAKVAGSWNLHCLSRGMLLDYFVLYSSGASFMGSAGQGNHAAANAFMDVLAHYRRRSGKPGLSINWGPWKRVGAATRGDVIERMQSLGIGSIEPEQGLEILEHLLASGRLQVGVFPMLRNELPGARSIAAQMRLRDCLDTQTALKRAAHQPRQPEPSSLNEIRGTKPEKARNLLRRRLEQEAIRTLGLDTGERIDPGLPLRELGLDSLMAVQLRNAVSQLVGASLPATLLFNYPSLGQLSDFLADEVLRLNAVKTNTEGTETAQTSLDVYSEDELARLLAEKIDELDV
jgi:acyl carrier protein